MTHSLPADTANFIMVCGLPFTGKSNVKEHLLKYDTNMVQVCGDDLILAAADRWGLTYQEAWNEYYTDANIECGRMVKNAVNAGRSVVMVRSFLTPQARSNWLRSLNQSGMRQKYRTIAIVCEADGPTRQANMSISRIMVPPDHLLAMNAQWQPPVKGNGEDFDAVLTPADLGL